MVNDDILKYVFAYLDAHKKGYLSEQDFSGLFSSYHWKAEQTNEFIDSLKLKFANCEEAFRCLAQYTNKSVNIIRFKAFLK